MTRKKATISLIAAIAKDNVIGYANTLPWGRLPADMKYFRKRTTNHCVIMGRKTYQSLGRPLPNRTNIVITHDRTFSASNCVVVHSLTNAIDYATSRDNEVFIIGGAQVFRQALPIADRIYLTFIGEEFHGDAWFPELDDGQESLEKQLPFYFDRSDTFSKVRLKNWKITETECHSRDSENPYPYCFITLQKKRARAQRVIKGAHSMHKRAM